MAAVGICQLQQNASAVIARAERGEVIDVTDRGRLAARIVPASTGSPLGRLAAAGRLKPASRALADLAAPFADLRASGRGRARGDALGRAMTR